MANIDVDTNGNLGEDELEQVKGGPAFMKLGDIKGEVTTESTALGVKPTYDIKLSKKV